MPLIAEHKRIARLKGDVIERFLAVRRKEKHSTRLFSIKVIFPSVMNRNIKMRPIIKSRSRDGLIIELKTERTHQIELYAQTHAKTPDRPGVVWYLGT